MTKDISTLSSGNSLQAIFLNYVRHACDSDDTHLNHDRTAAYLYNVDLSTIVDIGMWMM